METQTQSCNWSNAIISVAVSAAAVGGAYVTGDANCLWAGMIVPMVIYKPW
jgi:hypothetical protein